MSIKPDFSSELIKLAKTEGSVSRETNKTASEEPGHISVNKDYTEGQDLVCPKCKKPIHPAHKSLQREEFPTLYQCDKCGQDYYPWAKEDKTAAEKRDWHRSDQVLTYHVWGPQIAANPTDGWLCEIRQGGWALDEKLFDTEQEAVAWGEAHKGEMSEGVAKQYGDTGIGQELVNLQKTRKKTKANLKTAETIFLRYDKFNRKIYRDKDSGEQLVRVDDKLHTMTDEGEPLAPWTGKSNKEVCHPFRSITDRDLKEFLGEDIGVVKKAEEAGEEVPVEWTEQTGIVEDARAVLNSFGEWQVMIDGKKYVSWNITAKHIGNEIVFEETEGPTPLSQSASTDLPTASLVKVVQSNIKRKVKTLGRLKTAKKEYIPGGNADGHEPSEYNKKQLGMGKKIELEHSPRTEVAEEISMDHLEEIPDYYTRLKRMEQEADDQGMKREPRKKSDLETYEKGEGYDWKNRTPKQDKEHNDKADLISQITDFDGSLAYWLDDKEVYMVVGSTETRELYFAPELLEQKSMKFLQTLLKRLQVAEREKAQQDKEGNLKTARMIDTDSKEFHVLVDAANKILSMTKKDKGKEDKEDKQDKEPSSAKDAPVGKTDKEPKKEDKKDKEVKPFGDKKEPQVDKSTDSDLIEFNTGKPSSEKPLQQKVKQKGLTDRTPKRFKSPVQSDTLYPQTPNKAGLTTAFGKEKKTAEQKDVTIVPSAVNKEQKTASGPYAIATFQDYWYDSKGDKITKVYKIDSDDEWNGKHVGENTLKDIPGVEVVGDPDSVVTKPVAEDSSLAYDKDKWKVGGETDEGWTIKKINEGTDDVWATIENKEGQKKQVRISRLKTAEEKSTEQMKYWKIMVDGEWEGYIVWAPSAEEALKITKEDHINFWREKGETITPEQLDLITVEEYTPKDDKEKQELKMWVDQEARSHIKPDKASPLMAIMKTAYTKEEEINESESELVRLKKKLSDTQSGKIKMHPYDKGHETKELERAIEGLEIHIDSLKQEVPVKVGDETVGRVDSVVAGLNKKAYSTNLESKNVGPYTVRLVEGEKPTDRGYKVELVIIVDHKEDTETALHVMRPSDDYEKAEEYFKVLTQSVDNVENFIKTYKTASLHKQTRLKPAEQESLKKILTDLADKLKWTISNIGSDELVAIFDESRKAIGGGAYKVWEGHAYKAVDYLEQAIKSKQGHLKQADFMTYDKIKELGKQAGDFSMGCDSNKCLDIYPSNTLSKKEVIEVDDKTLEQIFAAEDKAGRERIRQVIHGMSKSYGKKPFIKKIALNTSDIKWEDSVAWLHESIKKEMVTEFEQLLSSLMAVQVTPTLDFGVETGDVLEKRFGKPISGNLIQDKQYFYVSSTTLNPSKSGLKIAGKETVYIKELIKRVPEKETGYDKNMEKEYWEFIWSDGTKDEGSLYQTQIDSVKKEKTAGQTNTDLLHGFVQWLQDTDVVEGGLSKEDVVVLMQADSQTTLFDGLLKMLDGVTREDLGNLWNSYWTAMVPKEDKEIKSGMKKLAGLVVEALSSYMCPGCDKMILPSPQQMVRDPEKGVIHLTCPNCDKKWDIKMTKPQETLTPQAPVYAKKE